MHGRVRWDMHVACGEDLPVYRTAEGKWPTSRWYSCNSYFSKRSKTGWLVTNYMYSNTPRAHAQSVNDKSRRAGPEMGVVNICVFALCAQSLSIHLRAPMRLSMPCPTTPTWGKGGAGCLPSFVWCPTPRAQTALQTSYISLPDTMSLCRREY